MRAMGWLAEFRKCTIQKLQLTAKYSNAVWLPSITTKNSAFKSLIEHHFFSRIEKPDCVAAFYILNIADPIFYTMVLFSFF